MRVRIRGLKTYLRRELQKLLRGEQDLFYVSCWDWREHLRGGWLDKVADLEEGISQHVRSFGYLDPDAEVFQKYGLYRFSQNVANSLSDMIWKNKSVFWIRRSKGKVVVLEVFYKEDALYVGEFGVRLCNNLTEEEKKAIAELCQDPDAKKVWSRRKGWYESWFGNLIQVVQCYVCGRELVAGRDEAYAYSGRTWGNWTWTNGIPLGQFVRPLVCEECKDVIL